MGLAAAPAPGCMRRELCTAEQLCERGMPEEQEEAGVVEKAEMSECGVVLHGDARSSCLVIREPILW